MVVKGLIQASQGPDQEEKGEKRTVSDVDPIHHRVSPFTKFTQCRSLHEAIENHFDPGLLSTWSHSPSMLRLLARSRCSLARTRRLCCATRVYPHHHHQSLSQGLALSTSLQYHSRAHCGQQSVLNLFSSALGFIAFS
jgi:hypothetical protein